MSQQTSSLDLFLFLSLCLFLYYSLPTANSLTLEMVRRDTIDFNLFPKNLSNAQKNQIFAKLSQSRASRLARQQSIHSSSDNGSLITNRFHPTMKQFLDSVFAVSVDIGSRPYHTYLQLDTGSSAVWVQCQGCRDCMELRDGNFNETSSTSYRKLRPNDDLCKPRERTGHYCKFEVNYEDEHQVRGIRSIDKISTIENVVFGCVNYVNGMTFGENDGPHNVISGIFGLNLGPRKYANTFMEMTRNLTKMKFSYCLPPWTASLSKAIPLTFGDDVPNLPSSAKTTPMRTTQFYLNVYDISVASHRLNLDPKYFRVRRDMTGGFLIDSGTTLTYLVTPAYQRVENALAAILNRYMRPVAPPHGSLSSFCYPWPFPRIENPPMVTFLFLQGATLEVRFRDLFVKETSRVACLTILPTGERQGTNILGSINQANYRFVYDLGHHALRYHQEQC